MAYGQILQPHEIEQLAFETARAQPQANRNDLYHARIIPWGKSRGGMAMGALDAWQRGWARGLKVS
jgi:hypothetical protein